MMMGERWIGETPVRYYLLAEHLPGGKTDYGLRLAVPDGDSAELRGLTFSSRAIRELLDRLMRCDVTPVSLRDIVEDWLISECHTPDMKRYLLWNGRGSGPLPFLLQFFPWSPSLLLPPGGNFAIL